MVAKLQLSLVRVFVEFGDTVLDCVRDSKGINVEDVRHAMVGPLRAYCEDACARDPTAMRETRPAPCSDPKGAADGS